MSREREIGFLRAILLASLIAFLYSGAQAEPDVSRISGMSIGCYYANEFDTMFEIDPLFTGTLYPLPPWLTEAEKGRLHRVYYPRTREDLIESYDVMVFDGALITHFTPKQFQDLDYAFREGGMTAIIAPVVMMDDVIKPTILREVVPISDKGAVIFGPYTLTFHRERMPVFLPFVELGIENYGGSQMAEVVVKQGATIWADVKYRDTPWLVSWRPGGGNPGMQWVVAHRFDEWWIGDINPYIMDVQTNMILHSMGRPLISDIFARREARHQFVSYHMEKTLILSMIDWAEAFGANTMALSERIVDLDAEMNEAIDNYLEQDYDAAVTFLQSVSPTTKEIAKDVVRLKDEVLFWVYLIEWLSVSGTFMVCGVVLWSLMVKRQLYRRVASTRFEA
jgi:hypothetical protein